MAANVEKMPWWAWVFPALASVLLAATGLGATLNDNRQLLERIATVASPGAEAYAPSVTRRVNLQ